MYPGLTLYSKFSWFLILLFQPPAPQCWDYRHVTQHLVSFRIDSTNWTIAPAPELKYLSWKHIKSVGTIITMLRIRARRFKVCPQPPWRLFPSGRSWREAQSKGVKSGLATGYKFFWRTKTPDRWSYINCKNKKSLWKSFIPTIILGAYLARKFHNCSVSDNWLRAWLQMKSLWLAMGGWRHHV